MLLYFQQVSIKFGFDDLYLVRAKALDMLKVKLDAKVCIHSGNCVKPFHQYFR